MFLSVITKNLNWEILTRILLLSKDKIRLILILCSLLENPFFEGRRTPQKKQYIRGHCLKRGAWTVCRFKGGGLDKKIGQCTLGGS